jgi:hypothetical protein
MFYPTTEQNLRRARESLQTCQIVLHTIRSCGIVGRESAYDIAVQHFYAALDRVWEAQCMTQAQL